MNPQGDTQAELIVANVARDVNYAPYCLRCSTMDRMQRRAAYYWYCKCGAVCDLRPYVEATKPLTKGVT